MSTPSSKPVTKKGRQIDAFFVVDQLIEDLGPDERALAKTRPSEEEYRAPQRELDQIEAFLTDTTEPVFDWEWDGKTLVVLDDQETAVKRYTRQELLDQKVLHEADEPDEFGVADPDESPTEDQDEINRREAHDDMQSELESGECAIIQSPASGHDTVWFSGRQLGVIDPDAEVKPFASREQGVFTSTKDALRAIEAEAQRAGFFPNVYRVNERGNVTQLHPRTGAKINSWV